MQWLLECPEFVHASKDLNGLVQKASKEFVESSRVMEDLIEFFIN